MNLLIALCLLLQDAPGKRVDLKAGKLFVPEGFKRTEKVDVLVHFHGEPRVVEREFAKAKKNMVLITIHIGGLSAVYEKAMKDPQALQAVLDEALSDLGGARLGKLYISSFSAGFGAVREVLKSGKYDVQGVILADSLHAGYLNKKPDPSHLQPFTDFAKSGKLMWITHSAIVPGSYAGTTETADFLIEAVGAKREKADEKNAAGMHLGSKADKGHFHVRGYDGDKGNDHLLHLQNIGKCFSKLP